MGSVRMGEIAVSADPRDELVALGLGSCIGLAIVDRVAGVAGLAHVVLPESQGSGERGKFADTAVPELLRRLRQAGAVHRRMEAAIAGGARMFEMSGALDIGSRNERAVREALAKAKIAVGAAATGGDQGRTLRVRVAEGAVTVRVAGRRPVALLEPTATGATSAPRRAAHPLGPPHPTGSICGPHPAISTTQGQL
jgi:chemotaxis protein CheD